MVDGVGWYLKQAGRVPMLTPEEEVSLGKEVQLWMTLRPVEHPTNEEKRIIRRGKKAKERMFNANLRLVIHISKRHIDRSLNHLTLLDLIQEGNIGLSRAIEKFDPARGYKFSTYSYWWVRQAVTRAIHNTEREIRLPINALTLQRKVAIFADEYRAKHGKSPSVEECSERFGVLLRTMRGYLEHTQRPLSLDTERNRDAEKEGERTLLDSIADPNADPHEDLEVRSGLESLDSAMNVLSDRDREAFEMRYGLKGKEPMTYAEIGEILNLSRERVRQIEVLGLKKMRARMLHKAQNRRRN